MAASGESVIGVGAFPGVDRYSTTISSASCTATSQVEAWILPKDTADHSLDEHLSDPPRVQAHSAITGAFVVTLSASGVVSKSGMQPKIFGSWNVGWAHT